MRIANRWFILPLVAVVVLLFAPVTPPIGQADDGNDNIASHAAQLESKVAAERIDAAAKLQHIAESSDAGAAAVHAAVPALSKALRSDDIDSQLAALHTLAAVGDVDTEAVPALIDLLEQRPAARVRDSVFSLLRAIGPKAAPAIDVLREIAASQRKVSSTRVRAAVVLGAIGPAAKSALPELRVAAQDRRANIRAAALVAIGRVGPEDEDFDLLTAALADNGTNVSAAAVTAFLAAGRSPATPLTAQLADGRHAEKMLALAGLARLGADAAVAIDQLVPLAALDDKQLRDATAEVFKAMGDAAVKAEPKLAAIVTADDEDAALNVLRVLRQVGPRSTVAVKAVITRLKHDHPNIRLIACLVLGRAGRHAAIAVDDLTVCLHDDNASVRITAAEALGYIGHDARTALPTLKQMMKDANIGVRIKASRAIEQIESAKPLGTASAPTDG